MTDPVPNAANETVDYRRTAQRPDLDDLPEPVRDVVSGLVGGQIEACVTAGGGFTHGFAASVSGKSGALFVKAAGEPGSTTVNKPWVYEACEQEAAVRAALPTTIPAPQLREVRRLDVEGAGRWIILAFELVDATMPGHPWTQQQLAAVEEACVRVHEVVPQVPDGLALQPLGEQFDDPAFAELAHNLTGPDAAPPWLLDLMPKIAVQVERNCLRAAQVLTGEAIVHGDLRPDNALIRTDGSALFVDWNWLCTGPAWVDFVSMLPYARDGGLDVERALHESELTTAVPPEDIDAFLCALLIYMIRSGMLPKDISSPQLRVHARYTARILLDWLLARWEG